MSGSQLAPLIGEACSVLADLVCIITCVCVV